MNLITRLAIRAVTRYPWRGILAVAGIGLGIAVVFAMDITNESARKAFRLSSDAIAAGSSYYIEGGPGGIDEELYRRLRVEHGLRNISPVVSGQVSVGNRLFLLLGIDPFASLSGAGAPPADVDFAPGRLLAQPNATLMLDATAASMNIAPPSQLPVKVSGGLHHLNIVDTIQSRNELQSYGLRNVLITDISTAQTVLGMIGKLTRIDVAGDDPQRIAALLPKSVTLIPSEVRSSSMAKMTRAFHLNLTALSLLALVIGAFLIFNTMTLSVLQRRQQFAVLRALGITTRQLFRNVLAEALLLGMIGLAVGGVAGIWLSRFLIELVSGTINDLYFSIEVQSVSVPASSVTKAVALALLGTTLAALHPAWEAMRTPPSVNALRSAAETEAQRHSHPLMIAGLLLWGCALAVLLLSERSIVAGFSGLFLIIIGFALTTPASLVGLLRLFGALLHRCCGMLGRMAVRGVHAALSRTQTAVAALALAVSAVVGVSLMITSFRMTVEHWLNNYLRADIYVSQQRSHRSTGIDRGLIARVAALPEVVSLSTGRWATLHSNNGATRLFVVDLDRKAFDNFQFKRGSSGEVWPVFESGGAVMVSESYAYHHDIRPGASIVLPTDDGEVAFPVAGVFYDYGSDRGVVAMHRRTYERYWDDPVIDSFALYLAEGVDADSFVASLRRQPDLGATLRVRSNRTIRRKSLDIFDRTFVITDVLRLLAVLIAVIGVLTALMAIQLERAKEFAVLRAVGLSVRQLWRLVITECGLMGLAAGIIACPLGLVMAWLLVFIVNRRSFGWSIQFHVDAETLLGALALSIVAAVVAGLYPAWRMSRTLPAASLQYE